MSDDRARTAVVYICDQRYHRLTEFSIASLVMHHDGPLSIYFFQAEYTLPVDPHLLQYIKSEGQTLFIEHLSRATMDSERLEAAALHPHISQVTLMKAYAIEAAAARHDQIAFVDSDILIFRDFSFGKLFDFKTSAAGVYDFVSYMPFDQQDLIGHTQATGVSSDYMNAGLLLIHARNWLQGSMLDRYLDKLDQHNRHCPYRHNERGEDPGDCKGADQCALNMTFENDWTAIDFRWNAQKPIRHTPIWAEAFLRHYTGHRKFLTTSNVNRDWRELGLLRRIEREVKLSLPRFIYDGGLLYVADTLKDFGETRGYKRVLRTLSDRMAGSAQRRAG